MRRLGILICIALFLAFPALASAAADSPALPARAYLLMDGVTGQVLHEYQGYTPLPVASTTKIMTAILALERGNPADVVTAGQKPYDTGGSTIYLDLGEQQTLHNLLLALMLESANDAAVAIAEHLAGSEEAFAGWMNDKARELGATQTHFVNSHGLHHPDHVSSAHDLALIARYAMQNQAFRDLVLIEEAQIPGFKQNPPRKLVSRNQLLGFYEGANGVKNGYTEEALLTNVASARRGETELFAVVLGAENRLWTSSMALLDFGFSHWQTRRVVTKGDPFRLVGESSSSIPAVAAADLLVTVPADSGTPTISPTVRANLQLPLQSGGVAGEVTATVEGKVVGSVPLLAAVSIERPAAVHTAAAPAEARPHALAPAMLFMGVGAWIARQTVRRRGRKAA